MGSFWLLYLSPWMCWLFSVSEIWQSVNCQPRRDSVQGDPDMSPVGDQDGGCSQWRGLLGCKLQSCVVFFTCVLFVAGMFVCLVMCHERKRVCVCVCARGCVHACMPSKPNALLRAGWAPPINNYPLPQTTPLHLFPHHHQSHSAQPAEHIILLRRRNVSACRRVCVCVPVYVYVSVSVFISVD